MKRTTILCFFIIGMVTSLYAQDKKWAWGVEGSLGVSYPVGSALDDAPLFRIGATTDYLLNSTQKSRLFLHSGLQLDNANVHSGIRLFPASASAGGSYVEYYQANPVTLRLPLQLGYSHTLCKSVAFLAQGGVYGSAGLFGQGTFVHWGGNEAQLGMSSEINEVKGLYTERDFPRYECGLTGQVGLELASKYRLMFGADYGFNSLGFTEKAYSSLFNYNNRLFYISAAFQF